VIPISTLKKIDQEEENRISIPHWEKGFRIQTARFGLGQQTAAQQSANEEAGESGKS